MFNNLYLQISIFGIRAATFIIKILAVLQRSLLVLMLDLRILNLCLKLMADPLLFSTVRTCYQIDNIATIL